MPIRDLTTHPVPYVSVGDLANYWGVSRKQIYKHIEAGTLPAIRLGPRLFRVRTTVAREFEESARMMPTKSDRDWLSTGSQNGSVNGPTGKSGVMPDKTGSRRS
jgi:excisionase family DNA binding protein